MWCASVELALAAEPLDGDPSTGCVSSCMLSVSMSLRSCCSSSSKRKPGASDTVSPANWGEKKLSLGERRRGPSLPAYTIYGAFGVGTENLRGLQGGRDGEHKESTLEGQLLHQPIETAAAALLQNTVPRW